MGSIFKNIGLSAFLLFTAFPGPSVWFFKGPAEDKVLSVLQKEAAKLDERTQEEVAALVKELGQTYQLDPMLILAVMKVESTFDPRAISNAKAYGLMQVRSIVVREIARDLGVDPKDSHRLFEHDFNIRVGVHYLSFLIKKFGGDINKALMAYNAGPTTVARLYKNRPVPRGGYQGRVLKAYRNFSDS